MGIGNLDHEASGANDQQEKTEEGKMGY